MGDEKRIVLNSDKDPWLHGVLQQMSIGEADKFFTFANKCLNSESRTKWRTDVLFSCNRIDRTFSYSYRSIDGEDEKDGWDAEDKMRIFSYLMCFLAEKDLLCGSKQ